jgi:phage tail protein X
VSEKFIAETVRCEEMTLSQLIWRLLRRQPVGYLERVLNFNPNMVSGSPYLTVGSVVKLPIENIEDQAGNSDVVRLWD